MFERFTDRARRCLILADQEARDLGHSSLGPEHLVLGMFAEGEGIAAQALGVDLNLDVMRKMVAEQPDSSEPATDPSHRTPFTARTKKVIEYALREALQCGHDYIGTEHLLLGAIREALQGGEGVYCLPIAFADLQALRERTLGLLSQRRETVPGVLPAEILYVAAYTEIGNAVEDLRVASAALKDAEKAHAAASRHLEQVVLVRDKALRHLVDTMSEVV